MKVYQVEHFAWPYSIHYQIYGYLTIFFSALHQIDLQLIFIQTNWYYINIYLRRTDISFCAVKNRKLISVPTSVSYKWISFQDFLQMLLNTQIDSYEWAHFFSFISISIMLHFPFLHFQASFYNGFDVVDNKIFWFHVIYYYQKKICRSV